MLYDMLSPVYDRINREIDYCKWADFIEKILENHGIRNTTEPLLDLACGTGKMISKRLICCLPRRAGMI